MPRTHPAKPLGHPHQHPRQAAPSPSPSPPGGPAGLWTPGFPLARPVPAGQRAAMRGCTGDRAPVTAAARSCPVLRPARHSLSLVPAQRRAPATHGEACEPQLALREGEQRQWARPPALGGRVPAGGTYLGPVGTGHHLLPARQRKGARSRDRKKGHVTTTVPPRRVPIARPTGQRRKPDGGRDRAPRPSVFWLKRPRARREAAPGGRLLPRDCP